MVAIVTPTTGQNPYDATLNTALNTLAAAVTVLEGRRDGGVFLTEDRYPGCTSDVFATATAARDLAIADCFKDASAALTTRPRPLYVLPCTRSTAVASGSIAYMYSWNTLNLDTITTTYIDATPAGKTVDLRWEIIGVAGRDMYSTTAIKTPTGQNAFTLGTNYNHADFGLTGLTWTGRQILSTTDNWMVVPAGQAFYDLRLQDVGVQWYFFQLNGGFGRLFVSGICNFNNAASRPLDIAGSDGSVSGQWYIDSRALAAGNWLGKCGMSTFVWGGQTYITPNSGGGLQITGRVEGLQISGLESNGLGIQAPEYVYDYAQHVGTGLGGGSPSTGASTAQGLIYYNTTDNLWYKANASAWSVYYDGSAAIAFNGLSRLTSTTVNPGAGAGTGAVAPTAGKVYQNIASGENFSLNGGNPNISYWVFWNGSWHGPSYWNQRGSAPIPPLAVSAGHVMTPEYVGTDAPGVVIQSTTGSCRITASMSLIGQVPGIGSGLWDGGVTVIDNTDPVWVNAEVAFANAGHPALSIRNSGAVAVAEVRHDIAVSQVNVNDLPTLVKYTGTVRGIDRSGWTWREITSDQPFSSTTPAAVTGLDVYVKPGEVVEVRGKLIVTGLGDATTAGDVAITHALPTGAGHTLVYAGMPTTGTTGQNTVNSQVGTANLGTIPVGTGNSVINIEGTIYGATAGGVYTISLAQVAASGTATTLRAHSYMTSRVVK